MEKIYYISKGDLYKVENKKDVKLTVEAIEKYKRTLLNIKKQRSWKKKDVNIFEISNEESDEITQVSDIKIIDENTILYCANLNDTTGIYLKDLSKDDGVDGLVIRNKDFLVLDIDYDLDTKKIIASYTENNTESHLMLIDENKTNYLTEGESIDRNPIFYDENVIYYDCRTLGFDEHNNIIGLSPRNISRLNIKSGELDEIISSDKFDYFKPKFDDDGNLYCIKKPYIAGKQERRMSFLDMLLVPVKLLKAIYKYFDFFTQRYSGETFNTAGNNPSKVKQKTEEEIFIEGNLININETIKANKKLNDKYPGSIPKSWKLIKIDLNSQEKTETIIKESVLDYEITDDNIIISNGKYIINISNNKEEVICKADNGIRISTK